jgi:hypothetical protein
LIAGAEWGVAPLYVGCVVGFVEMHVSGAGVPKSEFEPREYRAGQNQDVDETLQCRSPSGYRLLAARGRTFYSVATFGAETASKHGPLCSRRL